MFSETILTTPFITGLIKKFGEKTGSLLINKAKVQLQKLKLYNALLSDESDYSSNIVKRVFTFRTIVSGDRDVYLDQIYYPLTIIEAGKRKTVIQDNTTLPHHTPICLIGVAGQGKTITMKKMYLEELNKDACFPFFISLRSVDFSKEIGLVQILHKHLITNGVECDEVAVKDFITNVKVRIYFDGFDEIPYEYRQNAVHILEECHYRWKCNVICSTRPDTELCKVPGFVIYNLLYLTTQDVNKVLKQNVENRETSEQLFNLLKSKDFLRESIRTPILIDIFIVTCMSLNKNPDNISNYYDSLFKSLAYKHDFNKVFTRKRKSQLSDLELEECFTFFCFITFMQEKIEFTENDMLEIYKEAKISLGKEGEKEKDILQDIMHITNLIIADGYTNFTFIHKSIQDYYAAKYITKSDDENQELFWESMRLHDIEENFAYMCKCLSPHTYYSIFIAQQLKRCDFYSKNGDAIYPTLDDIMNYLKGAYISVSSSEGRVLNGITRTPPFEGFGFETIEELYKYTLFKHSMNDPMSSIMEFLRDNKVKISKRYDEFEEYFKPSPYNQKTKVIELNQLIIFFPEIEAHMQKLLTEINKEIDEILFDYHNQVYHDNKKSSGTKQLLKNLFAKK